MNKLQEAIEWARERKGRLLASAGDGTTPDIFSQEYREQASHLRELITAAGDTLKLLHLLADIRAAVGDPTGKLMQDELVKHCRELAAKAERLEQAAGDALMHLETNYDIDGNRMADSDAAEALRNGLGRKDNQ